MLPDRVDVLEKVFRESLVHHRHAARGRGIFFAEGAAPDDFCAERFEISWADAQPGCVVLIRVGRRRRLAFDEDGFAPVVAFHRTVERKADLADSGDGAERFVNLAVKSVELSGLVSSHLRIDVDDVAIGGLKTEILAVHVVQTLREQSGSGEQDERQRCLGHDERFLRPSAALPGGTPGAAKSLGGSGLGGDPCRSHSK